MEATSSGNGWGWGGTVSEYLATDPADLLDRLTDQLRDLFGTAPSDSQVGAWGSSDRTLRAALDGARLIHADAGDWAILFEYELPLEGGRRPDVLIFAGSTLFVIEFKGTPVLSLAHADQVRAYARDLADYHSESRELNIVPVLASVSGRTQRQSFPDIRCTGNAEQLADVLAAEGSGPQVDLEGWLRGTYAPLPSIVDAARRIFRDEPLPRVRQAESAGVNKTVEVVQQLARQAESDGSRLLVLIAGVPGSGKTLAGLRAVYEHKESTAPAMFLSGNGPLVRVLQDALKSSVFVKDLHSAILQFGKRGTTPQQHVIVFDEAQRAWDREKMAAQHQMEQSEPEVLIDAGSRIDSWACLVGLVGDGQEIHGGEEGGLGQWAEAIDRSDGRWRVHLPKRLASSFPGTDLTTHDELDLTLSLRSRRAEQLHHWVSRLLGEELEIASGLATQMAADGYPIRLFRQIDEAKEYVRERFAGEPEPLFGLLASSHAKNLAAFGVDNTWDATRRVRIEQWFNEAPESQYSGCQLDQPITEFMCQGLELDLPLLCWGGDMIWEDEEWRYTPIRRRHPLKDPEQIVRNTYRVLMTRGRQGLAIFVPPGGAFDATAEALGASGAAS